MKDITFKAFFSLNYKPVESVIDAMMNKPPGYFKFASRVQDHQEELARIQEIDDPMWPESFTIIHLVYFLMETHRFVALHNIDWNRICSTCLQYKPPRTFHCRISKKCVKDFHCHSDFYGKSINSSNHLFYFAFLMLQLIIYWGY